MNEANQFDPVDLRHAFTLYPRGVMAVAAEVDGVRVGLAVSAFVSVSLDPPLILLCFDKASMTWPKLQNAGALGVSVLAEHHDWLGRQLASRSRDRFAGASFDKTGDGALLLQGAPTRMVCGVEQIIDGGDHWITLLRVEAYETQAGVPPLIWHDSHFHCLALLDNHAPA